MSRATAPGLAFKRVQEAEKSWYYLRGVEANADPLGGVVVKDGVWCLAIPRGAKRLPPDPLMLMKFGAPDLTTASARWIANAPTSLKRKLRQHRFRSAT